MATTNDLKNGMVLNLDGQLWSVVWFQHHLSLIHISEPTRPY